MFTFAVGDAVDVLDVKGLSGYEALGGAKVHNLQVVAVVHQHVVRFQVQVDDPPAVKVVDCTEDLNQQLCDMGLRIQISEETCESRNLTQVFVKTASK